jgi:HB1/ASXL restriction endonuclease-like protein with HTH domain
MTFLEAAVLVLRRAGRPLPVREIADLAIRHQLLTHVGRDPEGTMKARLDAELARPPSLARVTAIRPDVFTLTEAAASVPTPAEEHAAPPASGRRRRKTRPTPAVVVAAEPAAAAGGAEERAASEDGVARAPTGGETSGEEARHRKRRRRGGRRAKRAREKAQGAQPVPVAPAPMAAKPPVAPIAPVAPPSAPAPAAARPAPADGFSLADAAYRILREHAERRPIHYRQIADMALKRKLVPGDMGDPRRAMKAALLDDQRRRRALGLRPRFHGDAGGLFSLAGARIEAAVLEAEDALASAARRLGEITSSALRGRLRALPPEAVEQMTRLALARRFGAEPAAVERQSGYVVLRGGGEGRGFALRLQAGPIELDTLRAFGERCRSQSLRALCATVGEVSPALLAHGAAAGVQVLGGADLCDLLCDTGVGVVRAAVPVAYLDDDLLLGLGES